MNNNKFYVIAKHDLEAWPHTWIKGEKYECIDKGDYITLASEEGQANFKKSIDTWFEDLFEKVDT